MWEDPGPEGSNTLGYHLTFPVCKLGTVSLCGRVGVRMSWDPRWEVPRERPGLQVMRKDLFHTRETVGPKSPAFQRGWPKRSEPWRQGWLCTCPVLALQEAALGCPFHQVWWRPPSTSPVLS